MPDFLTRRNGTWHFVRRVPMEFAALDPRGIVRHSTRIPIASDRTGRRAARVADKLNEALEHSWQELAGHRSHATNSYEAVRRRARSHGFEYIENEQLVMRPAKRRLDRTEALVFKGLAGDTGARAALLGTDAAAIHAIKTV